MPGPDEMTTTKRDGRRNYRSSEELDKIRKAFVEWVQHILDQKGWTPTDLGHKSDLAPSTILRIMNSEKHPFNISFMTIRKVAEGSGYPIPRAHMEANGISEHSLPKEELSVKPRFEKAKTAATETREVSPHSRRMLKVRFVPSAMTPMALDIPDSGNEPCPPQLEDVESAFAVRMPDDSLNPIVRKDMLLYFTQRKEPAVGDIFFVADKDNRKSVSLIEAIDEDGYHLARLAPKSSWIFTVDNLKDWGVCEGVWRR